MNSSLCEYVQFQRPFVGEIPIHSLTENARCRMDSRRQCTPSSSIRVLRLLLSLIWQKTYVTIYALFSNRCVYQRTFLIQSELMDYWSKDVDYCWLLLETWWCRRVVVFPAITTPSEPNTIITLMQCLFRMHQYMWEWKKIRFSTSIGGEWVKPI
jgi:hypothetical protein